MENNGEKLPIINLGTFGDKAIEIIRSGDLLDEKALEFISTNIQTSSDVWKRVQRGRTETELRVSVLNDIKHPNADSKYWQLYREANVQFEQIMFASYEWKENQEDLKIIETQIEELELDISDLENYSSLKEERKKILIKRKESEIAKKRIELDRKSLIMMNNKASASDRVRELRILYGIRDELLPHLTYGVDNPNDHQLISLTQSHAIKVYNGTINNWAGSGIADINNLKSILETGMKYILDDPKRLNAFMNGLPLDVQKFIATKYNLKVKDNNIKDNI